jgi:type II secretory pathway pseudopilin PulG
MASRRAPGFTLVEMMLAMMILLFGITALIGALSSSIAQRRTADAGLELCSLCDQIVHRVQQEAIRPGPDGNTVDLVFSPLADQEVAGFPGLTWSARTSEDPERPDLWLLHIDLRWLEGGSPVETSVRRVLPRHLPLRARVVAFRSAGQDGAGQDSAGK